MRVRVPMCLFVLSFLSIGCGSSAPSPGPNIDGDLCSDLCERARSLGCGSPSCEQGCHTEIAAPLAAAARCPAQAQAFDACARSTLMCVGGAARVNCSREVTAVNQCVGSQPQPQPQPQVSQFCQALCTQANARGCGFAECGPACDQMLTPPLAAQLDRCPAQVQAVANCYVETLTCTREGITFRCDPQVAALRQCAGG